MRRARPDFRGAGTTPRLNRRDLSSLGRYIAAKLDKAGEARRSFASRHGMSPQLLAKLMRSTDPKLSTLRRVAAMFDTTAPRLLSDMDRADTRRREAVKRVRRQRPPTA